jgi:osmotically-inducible protein OsmY
MKFLAHMNKIDRVGIVAAFLILATVAQADSAPAGTNSLTNRPAQAVSDLSRGEISDGHQTVGATGIPGKKEGPLDRALTAKVRATLASRDSGSSATGPSARSDIEVSSFHGVVTLRGKVNSQAEKQALVDKVQSLGGVTIVKNELQVTSPPSVDQGSPARGESNRGAGKIPKSKG